MDDFQNEVGSVMRQTRNILMPHWGNVEERSKGGSAVNVVTEVDLEIERFLAKELGALNSSISFAGEEFGGSRDEARFWLCDPIDGTAHFVRGLPFCTVMLALIENQVVTRSFIYDFVNDVLYHAKRGEGAYRNEERIQVSDRPLAQAYMGWESRDREANRELERQTILLKTINAGFEFAMVASGKFDGRIQLNPYGQDYDMAAGSLLVHEAGGVVVNVGKDTYDYRDTSFFAVNPVIYKELTEGERALFPKGATK